MAWGADGPQSELIIQSPSFIEHARGLDDRMPALRMQGPAVFRWATTRMPPLAHQALERAGMKPEQLDAFVPHQANARITDGLVGPSGCPSTWLWRGTSRRRATRRPRPCRSPCTHC